MRSVTKLVCLTIAIVAALGIADAPAQEAPPANETHQQKVDRITKLVEEVRGLKFKTPVKVEVLPRDVLKQEIEKELDTELPQEMALKMQKTLAKFGLIPAKTDLRKLYVDLFAEQIAGFYDPRTKRLCLIKETDAKGESETDPEIPAEEMKKLQAVEDNMTIAHELTHALQDQYFDLLTLPGSETHDDDVVLASECLIEGEATSVMMEALNREIGIVIPPEAFMEMFEETMKGGGKGDSAFDRAPMIIRATLLAPYMHGLSFARRLIKDGKYDAVERIYSDLPASSEQILHAGKFDVKRDPPQAVQLADISGILGKDWQEQYRNVHGEFGLGLLFKEFFPKAKSAQLCSGWDGDRYTVFEHGATGRMVLVWFTTWDSDKDAEEFRTGYVKLLKKKYHALAEMKPSEETATSAQWLVNTDAGNERHVVERRGTDVLVGESCPEELFDSVVKALWDGTKKQEISKVERAPAPAPEEKKEEKKEEK
jgi:hypothetical protein